MIRPFHMNTCYPEGRWLWVVSKAMPVILSKAACLRSVEKKENDMTTKERSYLKGLAMQLDPILSLGKSSLTPEFTEAVNEAITKRELIKINVLKNCTEDPNALAVTLGERTHSEVVQVIGRKIVLFRQNQEKSKIEFPGKNKRKQNDQ